mgnify:CR=1 FL=1
MSGNYNNAFQPPLMAYPFPMHNQALFEQPYLPPPMPTQYPNPRALVDIVCFDFDDDFYLKMKHIDCDTETGKT